MQYRFKCSISLLATVATFMMMSPVGLAVGRHPAAVKLTPTGQRLEAQYAATLARLRRRIQQLVPSMDPGMTHPFMEAYKAESPSKKSKRGRNRRMFVALGVKRCQQLAAPLLDMARQVLSSDQHDAELVKASVIADATPRGLAAFAQKSAANRRLISQLLSNPSLMKQMQEAGGARNGNYGLTMQIYTRILQASKRADSGVLRRLALATALSQRPHLRRVGPNKGELYNPVKRYLAYQNAYLKGELDPYFPTLSTWDYRYVIDEPRSDAEIAWIRTVLENYIPSTVFDRNYLDVVHIDVGYSHEHLGIVPGNFISQLIAGGGECGARAWVGRLAERAFGVPVWGVKQVGHAALAMWTPTGWTTAFSAGFKWDYWDHRTGLNFALEAHARNYPQQFMKVLRARWIAAALGETAPDGMAPGTGGLWYALADCQQRAIVASGKPTLVVPTIKQLMEKYGPTLAEKVQRQPVLRSAMEISVDAHGVIHIPVAACHPLPKRNPRALVTRSFTGGLQMHYSIFVHSHPPTLTYMFNAPHGGKYELSAEIVTLRPETKAGEHNARSQMTVQVNHNPSPAELPIPWTNGAWQLTRPIAIRLKSGANTVKFSPGDNFHAVSIKYFLLRPSH